jgi:oxalate decarboxylase/phosphoglucose isomerase-like protein (cupin superfamily)
MANYPLCTAQLIYVPQYYFHSHNKNYGNMALYYDTIVAVRNYQIVNDCARLEQMPDQDVALQDQFTLQF